jgi:hypothetical protein
MEARQLFGGATFPHDVLRVIFDAFDDAWTEIGPCIGDHPDTVESARLSLAEIVLSLAKSGHVDRATLKDASVRAFRLKHRVA